MPKKNPKEDKDEIIYDLYKTLDMIVNDFNINLDAIHPKTLRSIVDLARRRASAALEIEEAANIFENYET